MRIGIDARFYGPKQKGLGRYVQKLVENLEKIDLVNQYVIFLRQENWNEYQPKNPNFQKALASYRWYTLKEQLFLPLKIREAKVDLVHFPHFNVPIFYQGPLLVTIHDLILKKFPTRRASTLGPFLYWLKNLGYQITIQSAVKKAQKIIALSHYGKEDILKYFRVKPEKIEVIHEGVDKKLEIKNYKLKIKTPYLLYVGNAYPHKNLERLVLAFEKISQERPDLHLVLVGEMDYFYQKLRDWANQTLPAAVFQKIIFTDFVSDHDLAGLYQKAGLYVFPSLYEGFGLPPLEAMAFGLPVASSKTSCLPEILGQAAIYFDPENIEKMTTKIKFALENQELREQLIQAGFEKIKEYSWQKMAQETLAVYQKFVV